MAGMVDRDAGAAYICGMNIGTRIFTLLHGRRVGSDTAGNIYYTLRRAPAHGRTRRWVDFAGPAEASAVPPEWHSWLHYTTDEPLPTNSKPWRKPHIPNLTGTPGSYRPPGHDYEGGHRAEATGDYEAWTPEQSVRGS
jgi:NADH:ubiquinone oxidoreductase subunit